jgi:hypothetical protein
LEEVSVLDDFRFKKRMPSRASAVRELLKRGLAAEGFTSAVYGSKSGEYGVVGKTPRQDAADRANATTGYGPALHISDACITES